MNVTFSINLDPAIVEFLHLVTKFHLVFHEFINQPEVKEKIWNVYYFLVELGSYKDKCFDFRRYPIASF